VPHPVSLMAGSPIFLLGWYVVAIRSPSAPPPAP
jgi:hypothetical protein